ncbi:dTMP kinase [Cellulomonas pakistanensis]|uniref:dTMP kinase n=1 Tax=Cellulomonas pakistanensis TaxID=992287 RepID=UPI00194220F1|nr:dTMP kinase [Cellulomonas pakistanensis]
MTHQPAPAHRPVPTVAGGLFVSFEGGDGAGKSTQSRLLGDWLSGLGLTVVLTREPGGTDLGRVLRREVLHGGHVDARTEALLYAADRAHHVASLVRPALAAGSVVVTDRYLDSSVAYQGTGRELGAQEVEDLSLWATGGLLPALTVLLDLDPADGLGRLRARPDQPDRLESAGDEFHRRTREAFLGRAAADPGRWLVLDAARPVDDIAADVRARVAALLGLGARDAEPGAPDAADAADAGGAR